MTRSSLGGAPVAGSLDAMMLDQKRAFDEIVERYAKDQRVAASASSATASTSRSRRRWRGRTSMRRWPSSTTSRASKKYDLIILDTPPTANALDFLDAPERLTSAIDSPAIQWLTKPYMAAGRFSLKAVGMGAAFVLKRLARFVGSAFLDDMAQFFVEFNAILGGFKERAREVFELLRRPDVAFVLVSSAEPPSVDEAIYFYDRLVQSHMPLGAFVVNRVHHAAPSTLERQEVIARLTARPELRGYSPDDLVQVASDFERTHREFQALAEIDAREVATAGRALVAKGAGRHGAVLRSGHLRRQWAVADGSLPDAADLPALEDVGGDLRPVPLGAPNSDDQLVALPWRRASRRGRCRPLASFCKQPLRHQLGLLGVAFGVPRRQVDDGDRAAVSLGSA